MIAHDASCACRVCRFASDIEQVDRDYLAQAWADWISTTDGEVNKLRSGDNGAMGSPRFVALKAIAAARRAAERHT